MRGRPDNQLVSTRRSKSFYPVDNPELQRRMAEAIPRGFYIHLLQQDLEHVVPYTMGRDDGPRARVVSDDAQRATTLINNALSDRRGHAWLDDSVRTFINKTAQNLVLSGPVTYEIDYLFAADSELSGPPAEFSLDMIQPGTFAYRGHQPIQHVLSTLGTQIDDNGLTFVELDPERLVTFTLDTELERAARGAVAFLRGADEEKAVEFQLAERSMRMTTPYLFSEHMKEKAELFALATEPIGWNTRELFKQNHLEPYDLWRSLRFLEFKVRVRDRILKQLNDTIRMVGLKMNFAASLALDGVASISDVEAAKADLASGRRGIGDLSMFAVTN